MNLIDLRYPFDGLIEFYGNYFFQDLQAFHLTLAHILILGCFTASLIANHRRLLSYIAVYAMFGTLISNPSFKFSGLNVFDWMAVASCFSVAYLSLSPQSMTWSKIEIGFILSLCGLFLHSIFAFYWYGLDQLASAVERIALAFRPLSTFLIVKLFAFGFKESERYRRSFKRDLIAVLAISGICYLTQYFMLALDIIPYGTMASAGFGGQRFGGISIEGGHLSKFTFPLLISFYLMARNSKDYAFAAATTVVFLMNVSASGYCYLLVFVGMSTVCSVFYMAKGRLRKANIITALFIAAVLILLGSFTFKPALMGLIDKIASAIKVMGDPELDIYGRSPLISVYSLSEFPLGTGFGGSTHRNLVAKALGIYENNLGINIILSSISLAVIPLMFFLIFIAREGLRKIILIFQSNSAIRSSLYFGYLMALLAAFLLDSLWTIPSYYLGLIFLLQFKAPLDVEFLDRDPSKNYELSFSRGSLTA